MEHRIHLTRREQQNTLQLDWLLPVSINGRSPFSFAIEPSRTRTLISARTIEAVGVSVGDMPATLTISDKLAYPLLRLDSIAVGGAVMNDFEVVVWGKPAMPPEVLASLAEDTLEDILSYPLGNHPLTAIDAIIECRGVLGVDFLRNFKVSFDFAAETLALER
jgi:hypothetical protein